MSGNVSQKREFWREKTLSEMDNEEWESLCDGCGLCCLHKMEDDETGAVAHTNVSCRLLDIKTCRCTKYPMRKVLVPDCVILTPEKAAEFKWLPSTCAYRLMAGGKELPAWHPLKTGTSESVHKKGISVREIAVSERDAGDLEDHIIHWQILED
jgi:uncharacterized cysteine cluster protein YcgN (CxxCxxCC family)